MPKQHFSDATLRVTSILTIGVLCASFGVVAWRWQSIAAACLSLWLAFALVVETWPRKDRS